MNFIPITLKVGVGIRKAGRLLLGSWIEYKGNGTGSGVVKDNV
jgi:hypothetical protein